MDESWREQARCRGLDMEIFFPSTRGKTASTVYAEGKKVCAFCPVRRQCFLISEEFVSSGDRHGLFGGLTPAERKLKRRKGRFGR